MYIYILTRVTLYCPMITNFVNSRSSMENGLWFMENALAGKYHSCGEMLS